MATTYIAPFAKLVRQILIKERRASAREVASSLGLSYGAFHNRLNGRAHFSPDEITRLLCELDDIRLADCLLGQSGFLAVRSPVTGENHVDRTASKLGFSCVAEVLSALQGITDSVALHYFERKQRESALQGITDSVALHYFERKQRAEIEEHVRNAQRGLAALQLALPHLFTTSNINNNLKSA